MNYSGNKFYFVILFLAALFAIVNIIIGIVLFIKYKDLKKKINDNSIDISMNTFNQTIENLKIDFEEKFYQLNQSIENFDNDTLNKKKINEINESIENIENISYENTNKIKELYDLIDNNNETRQINNNNNELIEKIRNENIENTNKIKELCNVTISYQEGLLPIYDNEIDAYEKLKYLCTKGLNRRLNNKVP